MTVSVSKQLLPIYDKPLIYYPLSVLLLAGIREILIISTPEDLPSYQRLFGDGSRLGIRMEYQVQETPRGLADAFILGESFIGGDDVCLVLGDNLFYGQGLSSMLAKAIRECRGATIFGCPVADPSHFGVVEIDLNGEVRSLEEKPQKPRSRYAVPGLYFYQNDVVKLAKQVRPSPRGELEITAINETYRQQGRLQVAKMGRGMIWLDTGTPQTMLQAGCFVEAVQSKLGLYIACLEEIAWRRGFIGDKELYEAGKRLEMTDYGRYLLRLLQEERPQ